MIFSDSSKSIIWSMWSLYMSIYYIIIPVWNSFKDNTLLFVSIGKLTVIFLFYLEKCGASFELKQSAF